MKKILLLLTLALTFVSQVRAAEITLRPTTTAAVQGGKNSAGSSKNASEHYINNWGTGAESWVAQGYIEFTFNEEQLPEGVTITDAIITLQLKAAGGTNRQTSVYCLPSGTSVDYDNLTLKSQNELGVTELANYTDLNTSYKTKTISGSALVNAVKNVQSQRKLILVLSNANAGAYFYGTGAASANQPTLKITYTDGTACTLSHTASTSREEGGSTYTGKVDAEEHYFNNDGTGNGWNGFAFAEFELPTLPEGKVISEALLTWKGTSGRDYGSSLYYLNAGQTVDYDAIPEGSTLLQYKDDRTLITSSIGTLNGGKTYTTDVSNAVKTLITASQNYIVFQWTGNQGGANLYGKASDAAPTLIITTRDGVATTYTLRYRDGENNEIKADVVKDGISGDEATATAADMADFKTADGTKKYHYASGNETITLDKVAENNVITLVFGEVDKYNFSVVATDGTTDIATVYEGWGFAGEETEYYYPHYVLKDGHFYQKDGNAYFNKSITLDANDKVERLEYTEENPTNVVFAQEAEDISGLTAYEDGYTHIRMSKGAVAYATELTTITTLQAGFYTLTSSSRSGITTFYADDTQILKIESSGGVEIQTSGQFMLTQPTDIKVAAGGTNAYFDYVVIRKVADVSTAGMTVTAAKWATFCAPFAITIPEGVEAYTCMVNGESLDYTPVETVIPANTPVVLYAENTVDETFYGEAVSGTPEAGSLVGVYANGSVPYDDGNAYYVLQNKDDVVGFYRVESNAIAINANRAYLKIEGTSSSARLFVLDTNTTTGIDAVKHDDARTKSCYNLNGQRVSQPAKGLYIVNGKKVVIK